MSALIYSPIYAVLVLWALWIFYLAVMNLKRARDAGLLSKTAWAFGMPVLAVGYLLDVAVNLTLMSAMLWELPREFTITDRLKRHHKTSTGWRLRIVLWFEPLLDPYDPSGDHI